MSLNDNDTYSSDDKQRSIRVVISTELYNKIKLNYPEHGQMSQLVRSLLTKHLENSQLSR